MAAQNGKDLLIKVDLTGMVSLKPSRGFVPRGSLSTPKA